MSRTIVDCPNCKKALWSGSAWSKIPGAFKDLKSYQQHWDERFDSCSCSTGKKLMAKAESMVLTLDKVIDFGKHKGNTVKWIIEKDVTYITKYLIEQNGFTSTYEVDEYLENFKK